MEQKVEKNELSREDRLAIEEKAIDALINMGVKFSVPLKIVPRKAPKWLLSWNVRFPNHVKIYRDKRIPKDWDVSISQIPDPSQQKIVDVYMRNFVIKPLYLGTIDAIRKIYIQIEYDEDKIQEQPIQESKKLFKYIGNVAKIAAIAVLNKSSVAEVDSKEVKVLQDFFVQHLTVSRLRKLSDTISVMMNAGGFTNSIRSIQEIGVTKPIRANLVE